MLFDEDAGPTCTLSTRHLAIITGRWRRVVAKEQSRLVAASGLTVAAGGQGQLQHTGLGGLASSATARLGTTWLVDEGAMAAELAQLKQASPGWQVLTAIDNTHPGSLAELARAVGIDRRTAQRLLTEFGPSGAICRGPDGLSVTRWSVAQPPTLELWRAVLVDWFGQDRALRAHKAPRGGWGTAEHRGASQRGRGMAD